MLTLKLRKTIFNILSIIFVLAALYLLVFFVDMGKLCKLGTLIHQQLNILTNDCDLSDKHVHYLHALHADDCEQSDKLNIINH